MRLRLNYVRQSGVSVDLEVQVDAEATVGQLAGALATRDPSDQRVPSALTLVRYDERGQSIAASASQLIGESGIRSGSSVALAAVTSVHPPLTVRWRRSSRSTTVNAVEPSAGVQGVDHRPRSCV